MSVCELCGQPMPPGEEMFTIHGYSGPCPTPPLPAKPTPLRQLLIEWRQQAEELRGEELSGQADLLERCAIDLERLL